MITAEKARKLSGRSLEEKVEALCKTIEKLATDKEHTKRSVKTAWQHKEDLDLWVQGGYSRTEEWDQAKEKLEELGFKVSFAYKETQFVDMYTLIEW